MREFKCQFATYIPIPGYKQRAIDFTNLESLASLTIYMSENVGALELPALEATNTWKIEYNKGLSSIVLSRGTSPGNGNDDDREGMPDAERKTSMLTASIGTNSGLQLVWEGSSWMELGLELDMIFEDAASNHRPFCHAMWDGCHNRQHNDVLREMPTLSLFPFYRQWNSLSNASYEIYCYRRVVDVFNAVCSA